VRDGAESGHRMVLLPQMVPVGSGSLGPQQPPLALSRQPSTATTSTGPPPAAGPAPVSHGASRGTKHARSEAAAKAPSAAAAADREAAGQSSRPRKRPQNDELERRCQDLTVANTHLTGVETRSCTANTVPTQSSFHAADSVSTNLCLMISTRVKCRMTSATCVSVVQAAVLLHMWH
jgi:hypothetical protein